MDINIVIAAVCLLSVINLALLIINRRKFISFKENIIKSISNIKIENKKQYITFLEKVTGDIKKRETIFDNKLKESVRILSNRIGKRQRDNTDEV